MEEINAANENELRGFEEMGLRQVQNSFIHAFDMPIVAEYGCLCL